VKPEDPLRGISNSLGAYRKLLPPAFGGANDVASLLMSVNYPRDSGPVLSDSEFRRSFLKDLRNRFRRYVWNLYVLWTSSRDVYEKHGRRQTFPEFASRFPDKDAGFPAFVFDLFNLMRGGGVTLLPRSVPRQWHQSGRWLDLDVVLGLEELRSLRYTKPGAAEYAMALNADVSVTELHQRFNDLMLGFGCWFESDLRRVVLMTMGRDPHEHHDDDSNPSFSPSSGDAPNTGS